MHPTLALLRRAESERFVDCDGNPIAARIHGAPLRSPESVAQNHHADPDLVELLTSCAGFEIDVIEVTFGQDGCGQAVDFLLPRVQELAGDGCGNFWILELSKDGVGGPVWFICHDPPVLVQIARSLHEFVAGVLDAYRPGADTSANSYANTHGLADAVWAARQAGVPVAAVRSSPDQVVASFATSLPDHAVVLDSRAFKPGDGYVWEELDQYSIVTESGTPDLRAALARR